MFDLSQAPTPPRAERRPSTDSHHGITRSDDFAWLRVDNWAEVMADPSVLADDVRGYLEAENAYAATVLAPTDRLQEALFSEFRGRIKEDDQSPAVKDGPYAYYVRFRTGGQYAVHCRKDRDDTGEGSERIIFDGDKEAEGHDYFRMAGATVSDDHRLMAWGVDTKGSEFYSLQIRDLDSGEDHTDRLERTTGGAVWAPDGLSLFYTWQDDNHRPCKIFRHVLGTEQDADELIYEEADPGFFVSVSGTGDDRFLLVGANDHQTTEVWVADLQAPTFALKCVAPRETGHEYSLERAGDHWFISTNQDGAVDFQIMRTEIGREEREHWQPWQPHVPGRLIRGLDGYKGFLAVLQAERALPSIVVHDLSAGTSHSIAFDEDAYALGLHGSAEWDTSETRFGYESPSTPSQIFDYDMASTTRSLIKQQEVPSGHDPADYVVRRIMAPSHDGTDVPVTVMHHRDTTLDGSAPLYLYGYGSYGMSMPANFSIKRLSLADRGLITATAHVRGGADMGYGWYLDGKLEHKTNTFHDFIAARDALVDLGWADPARVAAEGASAGGMLMGAIANMAPEKFAAIVGGVPFVDVLTTMLDDSLPLTPPEWPEWGNPIASAEDYARMAAYSPIDNVEAKAYPAILATGGLTDPRVTYWEPAKWVATLRERRTDDGLTLMHMNMGAGHGGASGRFDGMREDARDWAFLLWVLGVKA